MSQSLKNKTLKGTAWSAIDSISGQGVSFLVGIVLANILTPKEYGLIGILLIFIAVFNSIVDSGFSNALIRKTEANNKDYNTVFWVNMGISIMLFLAFFFSAPLIAQFFYQSELLSLTRVMACIIIINACAIIPRTILVKNIDFKLQTKISLISSIISGILGIALALLNFGVWALVAQQLSRQIINSGLLWIWIKFRPKFEFSKQSFKDLFGFGWKLMVSSLIDTTWKEIYQVVIGRCYSPATLGQYTRANQFGSIFSSNLTTIVQRVSYPALSTIQDDKIRLKEAYRRIIKATMLVTFSCMLGLAAIAQPMVLTLIGEKWLPSVPMLQIICFSLMLYPLHALNLNMLQVEGRSDLFLKLEIIKKIIAVGPILVGIFISIYWMLAASVVTGWFAYYLNAYYSGPFLKYGIWSQIKDILPSFGIALATAAVMFALSFLPIHHIAVLCIQLIVGSITLYFILETCGRPEYLELKEIVVSQIKKLKVNH